MRFDCRHRVAYRGDQTDPLEIINAQRRGMRRAFLFALAAMVLPTYWLNPLYVASRVTGVHLTPQLATLPNTPRKMTAADTEQRLRAAPASSGAPRDLVCSAGAGGWDYVCFYSTGQVGAAHRLKIGVVVNPTDIEQASLPYPAEGSLPDAPWRQPDGRFQ
jgi:hypothetical protein